MPTIREIFEGTKEAHGEGCGCVVCRAGAGERHAYAHAVAAMMLGCDFHGIERREHDGKPWYGIWSGEFPQHGVLGDG